MKKVLISSVCLILLLVGYIVVNNTRLNNINQYNKIIDYTKEDYIIEISPNYDFQHYLDYEGSDAIEFNINKEIAAEIGEAAIISGVKCLFNQEGIYPSKNELLKHIKIVNVKEEVFLEKPVYTIFAKNKNDFSFSKTAKVWNKIFTDKLGSTEIKLIIDRMNGTVYQFAIGNEEIKCNIDEQCASCIAAEIVKNNCVDEEVKSEYLDNVLLYLSDAKGIANNNENEDEFYQVVCEQRIDSSFWAKSDNDFFDKYSDYYKKIKRYAVLIRKRNMEIVKIWKQ